MRHIRERLTYGNVVATLALFIALGGTSYALSELPRNSVGTAQIRPGAVSKSDLRRAAVVSRSIRNGSIAVRDLSDAAQGALAGPKGERGPAGVAHFSVLNSDGGQVRGNATNVDHQDGSGLYFVSFARNLGECAATATLSDAENGPATETPPPGRVTLGTQGARVLVRTFGMTGALQDLPFSVLVACPTPDSVARWPVGKDGWTVVLAAKRSKSAARDLAQRFVAAGIPDVGILDSDDFDSLRGGFWVVYCGEFDTRAQATQALDAIDLPDAYIRRIATD
jgi:hypothetical protein